MRPRGEMDITLGFEPSILGSNPDEGTIKNKWTLVRKFQQK